MMMMIIMMIVMAVMVMVMMVMVVVVVMMMRERGTALGVGPWSSVRNGRGRPAAAASQTAGRLEAAVGGGVRPHARTALGALLDRAPGAQKGARRAGGRGASEGLPRSQWRARGVATRRPPRSSVAATLECG